MSNKNFYITTPIYYVNDIPHIGHAYTTIAADVMTRYRKMCGYDVFFCTGTDEHGQKIQRTAKEKGLSAQELADRTVLNFKDLWKILNISYDDFIRTTEVRHEETVQYIFKKLLDQGDIYKGTYEGWYCVPCETYVPESSMGDGNTCPDCGRPLEKMTEESYFLRTSKYQDQLLEYYEANLKAIMPRTRYNEIVSFIRTGLRDQSISRTTISWGIPVPGDESHVIYVWFDALINYLTVCGYPDGEYVKKYWPEVRHLVGKDIIRFHCVVWPIMLLALGVNPPVSVFAHGWWTVEGEKMSKSKGNVVDPFEIAKVYGVDAFRYFLLREVPFGLDGDFSEKALMNRVNSDLANDLGNLLHRSLQMIRNYRNDIVPFPRNFEPIDIELKQVAFDTFLKIEKNMDDFAFDEALKAIWAFISRGNKYIDETMPWKLGKGGDQERLDAVLMTLFEVLRASCLMVYPFIPESADKMWSQLGLEGSPSSIGYAGFEWGAIEKGTVINKGDILFPRIDPTEWENEKMKRDAMKGCVTDPGNHEEEIGIEDFSKIELRVAKVISVDEIPKANKLYKIEVDLGYEKRTIVSGIKEYFTPPDLLGRLIIVVCNLKPARLRGVLSNGMLLAAENAMLNDLALLSPHKDVPLGTRIS
ncbi:MAG: methionine--tRNA ligase [Synergistales bacterium]|nr:methionine--tRNA ligase [Synergistales bacterium]